MRDPDLVQRAERASIVLEQAWERWRAMHGLGAEPLPPVSSYVGYSLEEPWGQPRVVFGLRADEAELLAAQLDGHECAGPLYAEVSARADWRRTMNGPGSLSRSPYSDPFSVPAQARAPESDLIGPDSALGYAEGPRPERGQRESMVPEPEMARRLAATMASTEDQDPADVDDLDDLDEDWPGAGRESLGPSEVRAPQASVVSSPPLAPLPPVIDFRPRSDEPAAEQAEQEAAAQSAASRSRAAAPSQGPGYRGPRYRGFPPRYQSGAELAAAAAGAVAPVDEDDADDEAHPAAHAPQHVAKLTRPPRKRTKPVRAAELSDPDEQPAADQAR